MAAYTTIDDPEAYFQVKIYTGTGTSTAFTLDGDTDMQPDVVWCKERGTVDDSSANDTHAIFDSVRGVQKRLIPNDTSAEGTQSNGITAFGSDGFTSGDANITNGAASRTYVAWCWKASATSGFDMVLYTGNETNRTISHSLSAVPHFIVIKTRDSINDWFVYHNGAASDAETDYFKLNTTDATNDHETIWNDTAPTSSVFSVGTATGSNKDGGTMVAYLFAEKQGFSKFGSYTGNGNNDGAFVFLGFRPAYVMVKRSNTTGNWVIWDNTRQTINLLHKRLYTNLSDTEYDGDALGVDFLSNGFKIRTSTAEWNGDGDTMVYMAFAEAPLVNSEGVPANAR